MKDSGARQLSIAKINPPRLARVYLRTRLFRMLDSARERSVTWISGPAGAGKTTLVASYLEARKLPCLWYQLDAGDSDAGTFFYYLGLAAKKAAPRRRSPLPLLTPEYLAHAGLFSKRYFEKLCARLEPPFVLVFDNYQEVAGSAPFHDIFRDGLSALPQGIRVFVISRAEAPPQFASLKAGSMLRLISWENLKLTHEESRGIVRIAGAMRIPDAAVDQMHKKAQGWAAGLLLMSKRADPGKGPVPDHLEHCRPEEVFDYFASEVFDRAEPRIREFLIKTSLLPTVTISAAQKLTGLPGADRLLARLHLSNYFTEKRYQPGPVYRYHPLFREFLLDRARAVYTPMKMNRLKARAAGILEASGQIEDAAELLVEAAEGEKLATLILVHAGSLAHQGRYSTLEKWLSHIAPEVLERAPWLLYWKGACRLAVDPTGARPLFERAFARFENKTDRAGRLLAWSGIVESYLYAWDDLTPLDRWIKEFERMQGRSFRFPSRVIEIRATMDIFASIFLRSPWHPSLSLWEKRVNDLLREDIDRGARLMIGNYLMLFYTLKGDLEKAIGVYTAVRRAAVHAAGDPPAMLIGKAIEAYYCWFSGAREQSLRAVEEGLAAARSSGVHLWDLMLSAIGVYNTLASGDRRGAETYLCAMEAMVHPGRKLDVAHYHYNASWAAALRGDLARAREEADLFMRIAETGAHFFINLNRVAMAHVLLLCGERRRAHLYLEEVRQFLKSTGSALLEFKYHLARAHAALADGDDRRCGAALQRAFALGRAGKIHNFDWWLPSLMGRLCGMALERDLEAPYVRELIRRNALLPDEESPAPESWPWPYRVRVLGRFGIEKDGKPVRFSGKVQKKPLELLKLLAAHGGRELNEAQAVEALWPDAEGDAARQSLKTTLHRLRQVLGDERAVQYQDGRVGLDPRVCWTDVTAFEQTLAEADALGEPEPSSQAKEQRRLLERAIALYRGNFLDNDGDRDREWALSPRERLRSKFLRAVAALALSCEQAGRTRKAADWYLRGLDVDDLAEELYLGLMRAYGKLGRRGEAVKAYQRYKSVLASTLRVEPSPQAEAFFRSLAQYK